jgi:hypothetical protein
LAVAAASSHFCCSPLVVDSLSLASSLFDIDHNRSLHLSPAALPSSSRLEFITPRPGCRLPNLKSAR